MAYTNRRQAVDKIAAREPFTGNSLTGGSDVYGPGRLAGTDLSIFREDRSEIEYAVYSYATPIAWYTQYRGWHKVSQKFSPTTSHHQGLLYKV